MSIDTTFDPENRELYTAIMQAPDGYEFDQAVATTYSLDFETALAIPIAIVFRDAENRDDMLRSPLALLQSIEQLAGRIAIYCDAARIKETRLSAARLMALYEKTIVEVSAPGGGAFHPKVWCIRFRPRRKGEPIRMRLAVLSRNLTNDRSWDLGLCLDGVITEEINEYNRPVVQMLRALPGLANPVTRPTAPSFLTSIARDLERCSWESLPAGATKVRFAVSGLTAGGWLPPKGERIAILSPFVSGQALKLLAEGYDGPSARQLVARAEELDLIDPSIRSLFTISTIDERATTYEEEDSATAHSGDLEGLHAKAYLVERGSRLHIHLGSANATTAALLPAAKGRTQNVEVIATLDGPKTRMGTIEKSLFSEGFSQLLQPYTPSAPTEPSAMQIAERRLEKLRGLIARLPLDLACTQSSDGIGLGLQLAGNGAAIEMPEGVKCFVRPITVPNEKGNDVGALLSGKKLQQSLGVVALADVTRWLGFRLRDDAVGVELSFTLGARLLGVPDGRDDALLRAHITNVENFFRYLRMLLGSLGEGSFLESETGGEGQWLRTLGSGGASILEPMVRALSVDKEHLSEIGRLIERLKDPASGESVVPDEFLSLWAAFAPLVTPGVAKP